MNERFARAGAVALVDLAHEPDFALGRMEVRPGRREIVGEGWQETIDPRVMRVLVALARRTGQVVSRDDLIESCWDGVIVGEDAINRCISRLRKTGEARGNVFWIETVPRVGYRLIVAEAAVPDVASAALPSPSPASPLRGSSPSPPEQGERAGVRGTVLSAAVLLILIVATFALWRFWTTKPPASPAAADTSVAVLPFVNMSGDPAKEYFSDGFSEELLDDLSDDPRLRVAARTSTFAFKGKNGDVAAIARTLHVRSIVEGSVRDFGNRVRITAELIDSGSGYRIWSARYDRDLSDILALQDEVARAIAVALTHKILPGDLKAPRPGKIDPAVYRMYLQAENRLDGFSGDGYKKGFGLLRQVTARQPDFAGGWAEFSRAAWMVGPVDAMHQNSDEALAHEAAARALVLDPIFALFGPRIRTTGGFLAS
jgi:TolB-like protein/DNA-binding winged helix-turn-helix (wHTH) protein